MQIATWNVNSLKVRLPQVIEWLKLTSCDILALQELKLENTNFPQEAFRELGYYYAFNGQKTYNGVAIISKFPIEDVVMDIPHYPHDHKRVIAATIKGIRVICGYFVNGESLTSDKYQYKLEWLKFLHDYVANQIITNEKLILLGDFNIVPKANDIYNSDAWHEEIILCSKAEVAAFEMLIKLGLSDSFRLFNQEDRQYTWWDYRNFAFRRKLGMRIDHILITDKVKQLATGCVIDVNPRKHERPSDHTPIILTINH